LDRKRDFQVPPLIVKYYSILDCCASYILEEYEDLDAKMPKIETKKETFQEEFELLTKKIRIR
jgi:hypothetical protein